MKKQLLFSVLNNGDLFSIIVGNTVYRKTGKLTYELDSSLDVTPYSWLVRLPHDNILVHPVVEVVFLKFPDGDIIAMFPDMLETRGCNSYQHHGQHSPASLALLEELTPATKEEYQPLKNELSWYYNLKIVTPESVV